MKILITIIITVALAFAAVAGAETFRSLQKLQDEMYFSSFWELVNVKKLEVELTGTIVEILRDDYAWGRIYRIETPGDGQKAYVYGYENPCFLARSYDDWYEVGEVVTVTGELNAIYSSYLLPFIGQASVSPAAK